MNEFEEARDCIEELEQQILDQKAVIQNYKDGTHVLEQRIAELETEVAHWKANHDTQVERARILMERPDLPIERVHAWEQWGRDKAHIAALEQCIHDLQQTIKNQSPAWTKLCDNMPIPEVYSRVLIFTDGYDFSGEQVFDVATDSLNECYYHDPADQPEICRLASHWMPIPVPR